MVEVLKSGETAQGRRMQAQSRRASDQAIDDGRNHFALDDSKRQLPAAVDVLQ